MQTKRVIDAGPLHLEYIYPRIAPRDPEPVRREKRKLTDESRKRLNDIKSTQRLAFLMAANFVPGDHVLLLTFDDEHLPSSRREVLRLLRNFFDRLKYLRMRRGEPLLAVAREECLHGDGRWHIHALINNVGDLADIIRLWKYGFAGETPFCQGPKKNAVTLAYYMTKERTEKPGQKRWLKRGPLKGPQVDSWPVEDSAVLHLPPGAILLDRSTAGTQYAKSQLLFYMDNNGTGRSRRRPKARPKT